VVAAPEPADTLTAVVAPGGEEDVVIETARDEPADRGAARKTRRQRKRPRARKPPGPWSTVAFVVPAVLGALAAWFLIYGFVLSGLQEHAEQNRLYEHYRLELATAVAPLGGTIRAGAPVAMINAPAAHLHNTIVVEGSTSGVLADGPGHLANSVLPGQVGTSVILGRSVTFGAPFRDLAGLKVNDRLTVTTAQGQFTFAVEDVRRSGDRLPPPLTGTQSRLVLVSSVSNGWQSGWAPTHTVYVDAMLVHGHGVSVPTGQPTTVSKSSLPMQGDPKAVVSLLFWLEALVVVGVAVTLTWRRWGHLQTWVIGVPLVLLVLWGTSGALMRFLPNLL
jgi:sortase A